MPILHPEQSINLASETTSEEMLRMKADEARHGSYVAPNELTAHFIKVAGSKAKGSIAELVIKGFMAGAFLAFATMLAILAPAQGLPGWVGGMVFPIGFVMIMLFGMELVTGNFGIVPMGVLAGEVSYQRLLRNWFWVFTANIGGGVALAFLLWVVITQAGIGGVNDPEALRQIIIKIAEKKTLSYQASGPVLGWITAITSGMLCNWLVALGSLASGISRTTTGKILAMWLPIMTFFTLGFEHSIVNAFVIPAGIFLGADVSFAQWWVWNQLPVTLGNILGALIFIGLAFYFLYGRGPSND